jgi:hypothetical protein
MKQKTNLHKKEVSEQTKLNDYSAVSLDDP